MWEQKDLDSFRLHNMKESTSTFPTHEWKNCKNSKEQGKNKITDGEKRQTKHDDFDNEGEEPRVKAAESGIKLF